jgi:DnaK suppressor protein
MRKREVERYRNTLESQLAALVGHGTQAVHELADGSSGDELPDPNDRATAEEVRNWSLRLRDRDRKLIGKIQGALSRLQEGTFGTCLACGKAISQARLRARPMTEYCIGCKTEAESAER